MTDTSARLGLPFLAPAQAQKHVTVNEAFMGLDTIVQLSLSGIDATTPPAAPTDGAIFALGAGAIGDWAGQGGQLARWDGTAWVFTTPAPGWMASTPSGAVRIFDGTLWRRVELEGLPGIGVGTTSDAVNVLAVAGAATLLTHSGAGHQIKINKATDIDTASLLYQTGWEGRAEMGLAGSDNWSLKVSPDGSTWTDALRTNRSTAKVTIGTALRLTPGTAPTSPVRGDIYYDDATDVLRCHDGTAWRDLF